jgi:hypothetical protein
MSRGGIYSMKRSAVDAMIRWSLALALLFAQRAATA